MMGACKSIMSGLDGESIIPDLLEDSNDKQEYEEDAFGDDVARKEW